MARNAYTLFQSSPPLSQLAIRGVYGKEKNIEIDTLIHCLYIRGVGFEQILKKNSLCKSPEPLNPEPTG